MYHPVMLHADLPRERLLPVEPARRDERAYEPCYRSEAFAEDLPLAPSPSPVPGGSAGAR